MFMFQEIQPVVALVNKFIHIMNFLTFQIVYIFLNNNRYFESQLTVK